MSRPSFQFYPGDWQRNAKLRRCSHAERGIWIDVLCLMHDNEDEYGMLRWPLRDIAKAVGCRPAELLKLREKGVLKGADPGERCEPYSFTPRHAGRDGEPEVLIPAQDGPVWYSSRLVRDEHVRKKRGIGTRFGDEPKTAPKPSPMPPFGDGPSSASASSSADDAPPTASRKRARGGQETNCPAQFDVSDEMASWAVSLGVAVEALQPQTEKFLDHHRAKGTRFIDWKAAWRTWMRNTVEFGQRRAA